ncbi:unnamed protein product [Ceutorhynchus assimilis]|uniref:Sphingomyelin phosphodiesterase n=1 Tax=Ceutorhynchus assimilis TaxID=467358 RepID=A0A9P0DLI0_9CUCU|nr:unnamed protein product [Ceutorhynchus assimilis]
MKIEFSVLLLCALSVSCHFPVEDENSETLESVESAFTTLQKQLAKFLKINPYTPMNLTYFETALTKVGIIEEISNPRILFSTSKLICKACQTLVRSLQTNLVNVEIVGREICKLYIAFSTWTLGDFCHEIVKINKPILEYIIRYSQILTPEYACSVLLQNENCYYSHPALTWRIDMPEGGPPIMKSMLLKSGSNQSAPLKILHLTDIHISHDYEVGGVSNCGYPVCCKRGLGNPLRGKNAGSWGDYNCDIPPWLYANTLNYISNTHKEIDLIYFTGDIIDHSAWKASKEDNSAEIAYAFQSLKEYFPNVPVLPVIGNHEATPLNVFAPPHISGETFSQNWLYKLNANLWSSWLPQEALSTVKKQGYYAILVNSKLRVIVLNNNICYIYNWWLLYDTTFFKEQLLFLTNELTEAESKGQFVHILAHVFPGEKECIEPWEVNYNSLITRFSHIIKGQFFGHTHTDGLKIFYSKIDGSPINVAFNGASLTPYTKYNPNYKILTVDPDTFDIIDIETYYFNLTEANQYPNRTPRWQRLYSMKEAYSFSDLSPHNFHWLAQRLRHDGYLFDQYWRFFVRQGDAALAEGCNEKCRKELLINVIRTESLTSE